MTNSVDPDQMLHSVASDLGLHCLKRHICLNTVIMIHQGPVVQSVVSLKNSLRVISLTVLAGSIHNILIFFAEKM